MQLLWELQLQNYVLNLNYKYKIKINERNLLNLNFINYLSTIATPVIVLMILLYGMIERKKVFDIFINGAKDGLKIIIGIFPTLIGLFLAIECLSNSGILNLIIKLINPILKILDIPNQIMPLALLRPISGSASTAIATNIMQSNGVDSKIGLITATIMGSTETTLYTIAIYTSSVGIKKTRFILFASLMADISGVIASVVIWRFLS